MLRKLIFGYRVILEATRIYEKLNLHQKERGGKVRVTDKYYYVDKNGQRSPIQNDCVRGMGIGQ